MQETPAPPAQPVKLSFIRRVSLHWLTRLLLTMLVFAIGLAAVIALNGSLFNNAPHENIRFEGGFAIAVLLAIALVTRFVERRPPAAVGLRARSLAPDWLKGFAVGAAFLCVSVAVLALFGGYRVTSVSFAAAPLLWTLLLHTAVGAFEEGLFRGILFRFLEEGLGSVVALLITAAIFGAVHLQNPNATPWGGAAIAIEAGILLGAAYMATRSLWFVMGLHTAWNFFQGSVFGINVSGTPAPEGAILTPAIAGNEWLTGGAFGIEASAIAVVFGLALGIFYFVRSVQRAQLAKALLWHGGINVVGHRELTGHPE